MQLPPVIKTLLLLNVAMFIIDSLCGSVLHIDLGPVLGLHYALHPLFMPFQLITYMFMHAGFTHLFFNMFALWMFGRVMENVWGPKRFLIYYLACGIGAAFVQEMGQLLGLISPYAMTIGASGAVYGILLAFGMTFPNERLFIIPIPFPIKAKYFVCMYAAVEVFEGLAASDGVAHFAHLGGMLVGALLILYWRGNTGRASFSRKDSFWARTVSSSPLHASGSYDKGERSGVGNASAERRADYEYNEQRRAANEEIDRILDKVRQGGYQSLTAAEKQTLFDASKR